MYGPAFSSCTRSIIVFAEARNKPFAIPKHNVEATSRTTLWFGDNVLMKGSGALNSPDRTNPTMRTVLDLGMDVFMALWSRREPATNPPTMDPADKMDGQVATMSTEMELIFESGSSAGPNNGGRVSAATYARQ